MIRAELSKLLSLPATWVTLGWTLAVNVLLTFVIAVGGSAVAYSQAGFVVLGALATCSEYTGGQIRTTLTVMPRRVHQLTAKYIALVALTVPAALVVALSGTVITMAVLGSWAVPWEVAEVTAYVTLVTLLGAAVGALVRHTLAAVALVIGYLFVVTPLVQDTVFAGDVVTLAFWTPAFLGIALFVHRLRDA
ncbi:ABC transporter permease [Herbidospora mongoliensis]|uniref:ABC transporter permease n=1 Tax=Herbidospora mongoliensis TaxID=688067 RepID=UPI00082E94ED|nr:ABC transporter permease [Herbidospora mongoliensis]